MPNLLPHDGRNAQTRRPIEPIDEEKIRKTKEEQKVVGEVNDEDVDVSPDFTEVDPSDDVMDGQDVPDPGQNDDNEPTREKNFPRNRGSRSVEMLEQQRTFRRR